MRWPVCITYAQFVGPTYEYLDAPDRAVDALARFSFTNCSTVVAVTHSTDLTWDAGIRLCAPNPLVRLFGATRFNSLNTSGHDILGSAVVVQRMRTWMDASAS